MADRAELACVGQNRAVTGIVSRKPLLNRLLKLREILTGSRRQAYHGIKRKLVCAHAGIQIGFVDYGKGMGSGFCGSDGTLIFFGKRLRAVTDKNCKLRFACRGFRTCYAERFNAVARIANACRIGQTQQDAAQTNRLFYGIPGRTRNVRDNYALISCQCIEQRGFSGIRAAEQDGLYTVLQVPSAFVGGKHFLQCSGGGMQRIGKLLQTKVLNVFIRIVQNGMEMTAQVC